MPDTPKRVTRPAKTTTSDQYPTQAPPPSGDYSYTLEIVMNMQAAMGKLTEAVESLKTESKEHRSELASISKEIHGYKVGLTWVLGLLGAIGALFAWFLNLYMEYHKH